MRDGFYTNVCIPTCKGRYVYLPVKALSGWDTSELDGPSVEMGMNEVKMYPY